MMDESDLDNTKEKLVGCKELKFLLVLVTVPLYRLVHTTTACTFEIQIQNVQPFANTTLV